MCCPRQIPLNHHFGRLTPIQIPSQQPYYMNFSNLAIGAPWCSTIGPCLPSMVWHGKKEWKVTCKKMPHLDGSFGKSSRNLWVHFKWIGFWDLNPRFGGWVWWFGTLIFVRFCSFSSNGGFRGEYTWIFPWEYTCNEDHLGILPPMYCHFSLGKRHFSPGTSSRDPIFRQTSCLQIQG